MMKCSLSYVRIVGTDRSGIIASFLALIVLKNARRDFSYGIL
jgi:hypothetical protein